MSGRRLEALGFPAFRPCQCLHLLTPSARCLRHVVACRLENEFATIPDLRYEVDLLVTDVDCVRRRLGFNCSPPGRVPGPARERQEGRVVEERVLSTSFAIAGSPGSGPSSTSRRLKRNSRELEADGRRELRYAGRPFG